MNERKYQTREEMSAYIDHYSKPAKDFVRRFGVDYIDGFQGITADELIQLGRNILASSGVAEGYEYLSQMTSSGDGCYYDRLIGEPQHLETYQRLHRELLRNEPRRVSRAIDIGGATGMGGVILGEIANHVTVTDLSEGLLLRAQEFISQTSKAKTFDILVANAVELAFNPSEQFDVAISNAVTHYLTFAEKNEFYKRIHSLLKPGGRYYEPQQELKDSATMYRSSPRAELSGVVGNAILSVRTQQVIEENNLGLPNPEQFGFDVVSSVYQQVPFIKQVMVLTKI